MRAFRIENLKFKIVGFEEGKSPMIGRSLLRAANGRRISQFSILSSQFPSPRFVSILPPRSPMRKRNHSPTAKRATETRVVCFGNHSNQHNT